MIQPGDILCVDGSGWLSAGIIAAEYGTVAPARPVSHVGIFVAGDPYPIVIEALWRVKTNTLPVSLAGTQKAWVLHDDSITPAQRNIIVGEALSFSAKDYGYLDLIAQGFDAIAHVDWATHYLSTFLDEFPVCSFVVAKAYAQINLDFGVSSADIKPSDIMTFAETHPLIYSIAEITAASCAVSYPI